MNRIPVLYVTTAIAELKLWVRERERRRRRRRRRGG
jgi:hypothetical protein